MKQHWIRVEHNQFCRHQFNCSQARFMRFMLGLNQFVQNLLRNRAGVESLFGSWGFPGAVSGCQSGLAAD